ncbi:Lipoprotein signal peptidase [Labilithrix luteola]|uniref:Lipoprotein signal peptidase n=1 Tax=Labilithrix luteola TaxID=1391654 RepID=A0A0K1QER4_9BACT|nr:Lipoprotein signal peptidase [Labilithrix luteola]
MVELRYAQNPDIAFSALRLLGVRPPAGALAAGAIALLVVVAVLWVASRRKLSLAQHGGFAMVAAGAIGNVLDRVANGYVVDFIHVTRWPIFNVADIVIVFGVLLLAFGGRLGGRMETGGAPPSEPPCPPSGPSMQPW